MSKEGGACERLMEPTEHGVTAYVTSGYEQSNNYGNPTTNFDPSGTAAKRPHLGPNERIV